MVDNYNDLPMNGHKSRHVAGYPVSLKDNKEAYKMPASWNFPPSFAQADEATRMTDEDSDILQSIQVLLNTAPGERFLVPEYGFDWSELLFEPANGLSNTIFNPEYLRHRLGDTFAVFEPRVELANVIVTPEPHEGRVSLELLLKVKATGKDLWLHQNITA